MEPDDLPGAVTHQVGATSDEDAKVNRYRVAGCAPSGALSNSSIPSLGASGRELLTLFGLQ
ncbi:hypothetical protein ACFRNJ_39085 [Streptomyces sp. NPDC056721]|uniref:hypothetical protein n=1 Tax=Streptomyces sp. NPDC056721 TaxID=3345923 RepID=UPI00367D6650